MVSILLRNVSWIYNISENDYFEYLKNSSMTEREENKAKELWQFYKKYEEKKAQKGYIDFADMIIMVVAKFKKDREFLKSIANLYDYILVDEYQDTNPMQNEIIYYLGEFCPNIFAVGDDDQTIYAFQGAKITTMKDFIEHFEKTGNAVKVITFNGNRRSPAPPPACTTSRPRGRTGRPPCRSGT